MPTPAPPFSLIEFWQGAHWDGVLRVHLYQTPMDETILHTKGDFVEADFPGYAPQDLTPDAPQQGTPGRSGLLYSGLCVWSFPQVEGPEIDLAGFWIQVEFPTDPPQLVTWQNFSPPLVVLPKSEPIGLLIVLYAQLVSVSRL